MRRGLRAFMVLAAGAGISLWAQFTPEELAERSQWEEFLTHAEIVGQEQMGTREAVTNPWVLTLQNEKSTHKALWKNPSGRPQGFLESWKWEIAAYRMDKLLGLNMVPPTVERRFAGDRGSCQLWIDGCMTLKAKQEDNIKTPSYRVFHWNRALYLQRAFDNLIANEDRHQNQYLITKDFRMVLIDHSRSFRTSGKFTKNLIYSKKNNKEMKQLPAAFVVKLRALDSTKIREAVGEYLDDDEIEAVLLRRDLMLKEIDALIKKRGEAQVLY